ncbi:P-loop containing nucleoside triphosphate hydrolase protein [Mucor lusitanicus]|uniref:AIG1-type G domain-containing protein n=2 Tax=Mucor circinelloides f. lusitanicus TaxID=29924 RepID=A0A162TAQ9_MUCCL|nr:P-loop containing nucleoside triphosphate hydrolase protein [Mucor lusitanicus]OAD03162.1 hypothetical protein MUCCIDRAFT_110018 [Mucor lusitanicus CBS 277.49]
MSRENSPVSPQPDHYRHNSFNRGENSVRSVDSTSNHYRAPLPQPYHHPTRHATMWDLSESPRHQHQGIRRGSEQVAQRALAASALFPYQPITGFDPLTPSSENNTVQQIFIAEPDEDPMQHLVIVPLGKTGAGKSSLLNLILGYDEFKAKAAAKSVTDCITERTGVWAIDQIETIITVADTPGFADTMQRDAEFLQVFQDYILDLGGRLGIDAFLLVFQCDSATNNIMSILDHFNTMMQQFQPSTWWNHVMLVFTRVDYYPNLKFPPNILSKKQSITETLIPDIQTKFNLDSPPKYAFISSKAPNCSFSKKGQCDCFAASKYHLDQMRTLRSRINSIITDNGGRWIPSVQ